jgi:ABC-type uncharacterized transport system involved in gliding motility auxiliary subunit
MNDLKKYLKYLLLLGIGLCSAGIVTGLMANVWSIETISIIVAGIVIVLLCCGFWLSDRSGFWKRRSTQVSTNALVATAAVIAILGLINFLAVRNSVRIDLTENKLFTLAPQSQEIVENLSKPLKVWIFDRQPNPDTRSLLENYRRNNPLFEFEFVDPEIKIELAQKFKVQSQGEIYLEYGDKKQLVQRLNIGENLSEIRLTNAIEKILRDRPEYIYFLQGHGEAALTDKEGGLSQAISSLEDKGYNVEVLNLTRREIPKNANTIVIAGPKRELFKGEVEALKNYVDGGGKLLLMLDPKTNPGLEPILKEWGVQLDNRLVIDPSDEGRIIGLGAETPLISSYGDHPITKDFGDGISVYPLSRPIGTVKVNGVDAVALVVTNEQSWGESNLEAEQLQFDPEADIQGPIDIGIALTRQESSNETNNKPTPSPSPSPSISPSPTASPSPSPTPSPVQPKKAASRMVVFGSSTFATNGWFEQQLNGDVFLNSVNWLVSDNKPTLSIRPKQQENRRINLTPLQAGIIVWIALLVMPLLGLITAGIAWWRRRS